MTELQYPSSLAFEFLRNIQKLLHQNYTQDKLQEAVAYELKEFNSVLKSQVVSYAKKTSDSVDKMIEAVKNASDSVFDINTLLGKRTEKLDLIVKKASDLSSNSSSFLRKSKKVKSSVRCKQVKIILLIILVVLALTYIIIGFTCGWAFDCARSDS